MHLKRERALFVGRFQPPHYGHFEVLRWIIFEAGFREVVVIIGSAQESHTLKNPFTAGERVEMLRLGLHELNLPLDRYIMIPLQDVAMNFVWVRYVELVSPRFDAVVTRNPLVSRLFREYGYRVVEPPAFSRAEYSATRIREMMLRGDERWRGLVPGSVAEYIDSIGGVDRVREIMMRD